MKTTALTPSIKSTTKPVVVFTVDGTRMPKLLLGREDEAGPNAHSAVVTGRVGGPAKSGAIISLRWSFCQKLKPATQYGLQGQIKRSLYTRAERRALTAAESYGGSFTACVICVLQLQQK